MDTDDIPLKILLIIKVYPCFLSFAKSKWIPLRLKKSGLPISFSSSVHWTWGRRLNINIDV